MPDLKTFAIIVWMVWGIIVFIATRRKIKRMKGDD